MPNWTTPVRANFFLFLKYSTNKKIVLMSMVFLILERKHFFWPFIVSSYWILLQITFIPPISAIHRGSGYVEGKAWFLTLRELPSVKRVQQTVAKPCALFSELFVLAQGQERKQKFNEWFSSLAVLASAGPVCFLCVVCCPPCRAVRNLVPPTPQRRLRSHDPERFVISLSSPISPAHTPLNEFSLPVKRVA